MPPKTKFIQIRLTPEDKARLEGVAASTYLELSVWARMTLLKAADQREKEQLAAGDQAD